MKLVNINITCINIKKQCLVRIFLHPTGFEPVTFQWKTDYESGAFNHSATDAHLELMGIEPTSIKNY